MDKQVCNKCNIEKPISEFYYDKSRNKYRLSCKECINKQKRDYYANNLEKCREIRRKSDSTRKNRRITEDNKNISISAKLKVHLKRTIEKSYVRKNYKRVKTVEDILGCNFDVAVEYLLETYKKKYKVDYDGVEEVHIDHIIPIWFAKSIEELNTYNHYRCLRLIKAKDNIKKGGRLTNGRL